MRCAHYAARPADAVQRQDLVLCRSHRGLEARIKREGGLRCGVRYWAGAWEVEELFGQLLSDSLNEKQPSTVNM